MKEETGNKGIQRRQSGAASRARRMRDSVIVVMRETASSDQILRATQRLINMGYKVQRNNGTRAVFGVLGTAADFDVRKIAALPAVQNVHRITSLKAAQVGVAEAARISVAGMKVVRRQLRQFGLTRREEAIVQLLFQGCSNKDLAARLNISEWTVKDHLKHLYSKIGVHRRTAVLLEILGLGGGRT